MFFALLITLITFKINSLPIKASLNILESQPLLFSLTFNEKVSMPQFQLFLNQVKPIAYKFKSSQNYSQVYNFEAEAITDQTTQLEVYSLIFNKPLAVGQGKLDIGSYKIVANKKNLIIDISISLPIIVLVIGYLLSNITILGHLIIEYCQLYVLLIFSGNITSTLSWDLSQGLMLIPPLDVIRIYEINIRDYCLKCLIIPLCCIYLFAAIGFTLNRIMKTKKVTSIAVNIILDLLCHRSFINLSNLFLFNLLFNSIQVLSFIHEGPQIFEGHYKSIIYLLCYFSLATVVWISYLWIVILNPNLIGNRQVHEKYSQTRSFKTFARLHEYIKIQSWYTRNNIVFMLVKRFAIIGAFASPQIFQYILIFFQFAALYYLFTIRPFREELYMNSYFISKLLGFLLYLIVVVGNIYFSLGQSIYNFGSASKFLVGRQSAFLGIVLIFIGLICRQIYQKLSNLNYKIRLVKEENQFRIQIMEKNRTSGRFEEKREEDEMFNQLKKGNNYDFDDNKSVIMKHSDKTGKKFQVFQQKTSKKFLDVVENPTLRRKKSQAKIRREAEDIFKQFQMKDMKKESNQPQKKKIIWKDQSLLEKMIKNK